MNRHDGYEGSGVKVSRKHAAVAGDTLLLKIKVDISPADGARVTFLLAARPGLDAPDMRRAAVILSDMVLQALQLVEARHVEWLSPRSILSPEEFESSRNYVSQRRGSKREMTGLPPMEDSIDEIERNLQKMFASDEPAAPAAPETDIKEPAALAASAVDPDQERPTKPLVYEIRDRLEPEDPRQFRQIAASWALTAAITAISLPVALLLAVVHVMRGNDFRLSAHCLALSAFGAALHAAGMLEPLMRSLGI
ncbi:hypothetical protein ACFQ4E_05045 [Litorisediminicola beolgyonensis]|uniref:Uncharacterized protein n=2 Tax=Litorisediminicola beolgyonensis TaxID=1173614 RepID=A0ABW3ZF10_9RHOB